MASWVRVDGAHVGLTEARALKLRGWGPLGYGEYGALVALGKGYDVGWLRQGLCN